MLHLLHIGCGPKRKDNTTAAFNTPDWHEIRLDIDPSVQPDVLGTTTDLSAVASESGKIGPRKAPFFDLWAVASKAQRTDDAMRALALAHFPK